jgi:rhodanese-related sulfurtransferase
MTKSISANELKARIDGVDELALIDVREEGVFGARHILLCANIPLSQLELRVPDLVPRKSTPIVFCDAGGGLAERAAARLAGIGYSDIAVLKDGMDGWDAAGLELFSGLNVPSKAFGEFVEHAYGTPSVSAEELQAMMDGGENMIVLDSRPMDEFKVMNIPTGIDMPGAELVHRMQESVPDTSTTVVVNCAGRTRSIIGAQSLINAGVPNKVVALRNGTMGWHLAGYKLEHGLERRPPEVSSEGHAVALERAEAAAKRFGVKRINAATLDQWRGEQATRTLGILDVRTIEEFEAGHIADSRHAAGGQLVQATDVYVATQNARVVLVDDMMVRALMTASWLEQLAWCEVYVLESGLAGQPIQHGKREAPGFGLDATVPALSPAEARDAVAGGAMLIDLQRSLGYREKHAGGASWAIRARLAEDLAARGAGGRVVLTSPDGKLARLAAADLAGEGMDVSIIDGGTEAWEVAGLTMEAGMSNLLSPTDDVYLRAYDRTDPVEIEKAMNDYLTWEIALVAQIAKPGGIEFRVYPE